MSDTLRPVFAFYCAYGELSQSDAMNCMQLFKFMRDCRILDNRITLGTVRNILTAVTGFSAGMLMTC